MILNNDFLKLMNNTVSKNYGKCEKFNLPQQKEEETIWCQNKMIILQSF